jgi:hypothetical protein
MNVVFDLVVAWASGPRTARPARTIGKMTMPQEMNFSCFAFFSKKFFAAGR